ncbi:MAG: DUF3877 family protein [Clostridia bacterium]|nr:DUF3877 family protein [Clostridia bacterium]
MMAQPFLQDITDQLKEAQVKLGFGPSTVKLYYTVAALQALTGLTHADEQAMAAALADEAAFSASPLGQLGFLPHEDRVEVTIPQEGVRYVHEQVEASPFLRELIGLFAGHHHATMAEVTALFERQETAFVSRSMPAGAEFDCALYFPDGQPDGYCYFFKEEMGHLSYHRFRQEDAKRLLEDA